MHPNIKSLRKLVGLNIKYSIMKKLVFYTAFLAVAGLVSCEEKGPSINTGGSASSGDTTYTATPEASTAKKILIEEFTGAKCSNCPSARDQLAALATQHPDKIIVMELHPYEHPLGGPAEVGKSKYDFRNASVTNILNSFYGGSFTTGIPIAGIDRIVYNGSRLIDRGAWSSIIAGRIGTTSPVKLTLTNTYDNAKGEGSVRVKVAYTKSVTTKQFVSIAILENDVIDIQDFPTSIDTAYKFKHIFRGLMTPASGTEILSTIAAKEAGRVYEGNYKYKIDAAWKADKCHIVVFVHNNSGDDKEVLQVEEISVKE